MSNQTQEILMLKEALSRAKDEGKDITVVLRDTEIHQAIFIFAEKGYIGLSGTVEILDVVTLEPRTVKTDLIIFPIIELECIYFNKQ